MFKRRQQPNTLPLSSCFILHPADENPISTCLEPELHGQLVLPLRVDHRADDPRHLIANRHTGDAEVRVIHQIEGFGPELDTEALANREIARHSEIQVYESGAAQDVASGVAEADAGGSGEGRE